MGPDATNADPDGLRHLRPSADLSHLVRVRWPLSVCGSTLLIVADTSGRSEPPTIDRPILPRAALASKYRVGLGLAGLPLWSWKWAPKESNLILPIFSRTCIPITPDTQIP